MWVNEVMLWFTKLILLLITIFLVRHIGTECAIFCFTFAIVTEALFNEATTLPTMLYFIFARFYTAFWMPTEIWPTMFPPSCKLHAVHLRGQLSNGLNMAADVFCVVTNNRICKFVKAFSLSWFQSPPNIESPNAYYYHS